MNGRERILTALSIQEADRVPLFIHGINERPIMGIGRHLTSSNTYHPEVKPENVMAVFTAMHKYGAYPPRPGQRD